MSTEEKPAEEVPANNEPESKPPEPEPKKKRCRAAAPKPRAARVPKEQKEQHVVNEPSVPTLDPLFFGALTRTHKLMQRAERTQRLSSLPIV
jgi:hypothetical protein